VRNLFKTVVAAGVLAVAAPATAQYVFPPREGEPQPVQRPQPVQQLQGWNNVVRVNLGGGFYNSGYYNCAYYYPYYSCGSGSTAWYSSFLVGPQLDFNLGGVNNISVGFDVMMGTVTGTVYSGYQAYSKSTNATLWEPTLDYVAKFGPATQDTVGRFRIGGSMLFGPNSGVGGTFRLGGGVSFLNSKRLGVGLDLVLEGGGYRGYWIGGLQLMASPEFHF